ncbi:MAG TPA: hypothetical protein VIY86_04300, partial [Pirellulaceae bacterium]
SLKRSKAVGEPPLLLGLSVWAAAKNALGYVSGGEPPVLPIPATGEALSMGIRRYEHPTPQESSGNAVPSTI